MVKLNTTKKIKNIANSFDTHKNKFCNIDDENCSQISSSFYEVIYYSPEKIIDTILKIQSSEQEDVSESNVLINDTGVRGRGRP
ncbi:hypothetical protein BpHYR1_053310 [Brachionus plicatilis]|uniref:Uncharacterized protein n=1 Tax=Brachionus plicatilis TaxID=10195 RepID=A0A3M7T432_BRAPC|nr:hypothetical protein BpHYR1_053310 [Brachionus plicatilis]